MGGRKVRPPCGWHCERKRGGCSRNLRPTQYRQSLGEIKDIIAGIPSAEELAGLYDAIGALYKPEDIGIDPALAEDMLTVSAAIRNRLTLIRMRRVLDFD